MNIEEVRRTLRNYHAIENVTDVRLTTHGSGHTFIVDTQREKYIWKIGERPDFAVIYSRAAPVLREHGLRTYALYPTKDGALLAPGNAALYEYIPGQSHRALNEAQRLNAIAYIKAYNAVLRLVPFDPVHIACVNSWGRARSLEFLTGEFAGCLSAGYTHKGEIMAAIDALKPYASAIDHLPHQLIHADFGPDNFLFSGDEIVAVIDFTPDYANELYALCHFIYWNVLWENDNQSKPDIERMIEWYTGRGASNTDMVYALLLRCALYRFAAPYLDMAQQGKLAFSSLDRRAAIVGSATRMLCG